MEHHCSEPALDSTLRFVFADRVVSVYAPSDVTLGEIASALSDVVPNHCGAPQAIDVTLASEPRAAGSWRLLRNAADMAVAFGTAFSHPAADLAGSRRELFRDRAIVRGGLQSPAPDAAAPLPAI